MATEAKLTLKDQKASFLDQIKAQRESMRADRSIDMLIPGYEKQGLGVRIRPFGVSGSERKTIKLAKQAAKGQPISLWLSADTIIDATETIVSMPPNADAGENVGKPMADDHDVHFAELAELLDFDPVEYKTARLAVVNLFGAEQLVVRFAQEIDEWVTMTDTEQDEEFSGNSKGTHS